jgi:hypothetical protein
MTDGTKLTPRQNLPPTLPVSRRGILFGAGVAAAVHIVGCTTDESSNSTDGSGGSNSNSVAGADGGADAAAGPEAGAPGR